MERIFYSLMLTQNPSESPDPRCAPLWFLRDIGRRVDVSYFLDVFVRMGLGENKLLGYPSVPKQDRLKILHHLDARVLKVKSCLAQAH